jgi:hypothetical protein
MRLSVELHGVMLDFRLISYSLCTHSDKKALVTNNFSFDFDENMFREICLTQNN